MAVSYSVDPEKKAVFVTAEGKTDTVDWQRCFVALRDHALRKEDMNVLLDFRRHESIVPTSTAISLVGEVKQKTRPVKWAFVVSRIVSLGMAHMAAVYLERKNITTKVFRDREEAETWIAERE